MNTKIIVLVSMIVVLVAIFASIMITSNNKTEKFDQLTTTTSAPPALILQGILDIGGGTLGAGGNGKAIHLLATADIPDLSLYHIGVANNGGGTDGPEYQLPALSAMAGDNIFVTRNIEAMRDYGIIKDNNFAHIFEGDNNLSHNGDDAIELFYNETVIETYGDVNVDGTGNDWEYMDSWAYKVNGEWVKGTVNCTDGSITTCDSECPYPFVSCTTSPMDELTTTSAPSSQSIDLNAPLTKEEFDDFMDTYFPAAKCLTDIGFNSSRHNEIDEQIDNLTNDDIKSLRNSETMTDEQVTEAKEFYKANLKLQTRIDDSTNEEFVVVNNTGILKKDILSHLELWCMLSFKKALNTNNYDLFITTFIGLYHNKYRNEQFRQQNLELISYSRHKNNPFDLETVILYNPNVTGDQPETINLKNIFEVMISPEYNSLFNDTIIYGGDNGGGLRDNSIFSSITDTEFDQIIELAFYMNSYGRLNLTSLMCS